MWKKARLHVKTFIAFLIVALVPFLCVSIFFFFHVKTSSRNMLDEERTRLVQELGNEVERTIFSAYINIKSLSKNPIIRYDTTSLRDKLYEMRKTQDYYKVFEDITYLNTKGRVLLSTTYEYRGEWRHKEWFKKARLGEIVVSPVHAILMPFRLVIIVTAPVIGSNGKVKAVIAGQINMKKIWQITEYVKLGKTGYVFITDKAMNLLAFPHEDKLLYKIGPYSIRKALAEKDSSSFEYRNKEGVRKICHFTTLKGYESYKGQSWRLGIIQDSAEAFSILSNMQIMIILVGLFCFFLIFVLSVVASNKLVAPIRILANATQRIAQGDLNTRVKVLGKDEIGELADLFNKMVEDLAQSTTSILKLHEEIQHRRSAEKEIKEKNTELEQAFAELRDAQDQLIQSKKMAAVGQLAGGVAHEINNPMAVILGFSQIMLKQLQPDDPLRRPIESIQREANRCKELVRNLLVFSRKAKKGQEYIDLSAVVKGAIKLVEHQIRLGNIKIEQDFTPNIRLYADQNGIEQIIVNLMLNSNDAIFSGRGTISVKTWKENDCAFISVQDSGHGIKKENIEKIFEPFFTTKEVGKGTGLGLSVIYEIVKRHNGDISVESSEGKGTRFILRFPMEKRIKQRRTYNVLIVDDDPRSVKLVKYMLQTMEESFVIMSASDGLMALEKMGDTIPDLIITAIKMPNMSGIEFSKAVRQRFVDQHIKILMMSTQTRLITKAKATQLAISSVMEKPIERKSLTSIVKSILSELDQEEKANGE